MANISEAKGRLTIVTESEEDMFTIVDVIRTICQNFDYETYLFEANQDDFNLDKAIYYDGEYKVDFSFSGAGRWEYASNIEHFTYWVNDKLEKSNNLALIEKLQSMYFQFEYIYNDRYDCESYDVEIIAEHQKGVSLYKSMDFLLYEVHEPKSLIQFKDGGMLLV